MSEWVLILVLVTGRMDGGAAIGNVPGFASQAECAEAIKRLGNVYPSQYQGFGGYTVRATCVMRTGAKPLTVE